MGNMIYNKEILNDNTSFVKEISNSIIQKRVKELGHEISKYYKNMNPIIVCVLKGGLIFMADLIRNIDIEFEVDFITVKSYDENNDNTGDVFMLDNIRSKINNRHILIVEDIIDSGKTISFIKKQLLKDNVKSIKYITLLYKPSTAKHDFSIDWIAFNVKDYFYFGYGMDYKYNYRGLKDIYKLNKEDANG